MEEDALERTLRRTRFGRDCGLVVRQEYVITVLEKLGHFKKINLLPPPPKWHKFQGSFVVVRNTFKFTCVAQLALNSSKKIMGANTDSRLVCWQLLLEQKERSAEI